MTIKEMKYERKYGAFFEKLENGKNIDKKMKQVIAILESDKILRSPIPGYEANNRIENIYNVDADCGSNNPVQREYYEVFFYLESGNAIKVSTGFDKNGVRIEHIAF